MSLRCFGRVQNVGGWIIVVDRSTGRIVARSANVGDQWTSAPMQFWPHGTTRVVDAGDLPLLVSSHRTAMYSVFYREVPGSEGLTLMEGCPLHHLSPSRDCAAVRDIVDLLCSFNDEASLFRGVCEGIHTVVKFDRAMAYQFDAKWNGQVIFERILDGATHSYMGLHFPESDIPRAARDMYLEQRVRFIYDVGKPELDIVNGTGADIDLSEVQQRGVSGVHVRYMTNMGIRGSVSIAIIVRGALWGLLVMHSNTGYTSIDSVTMDTCKIICSIISMKMDEFWSKRRDEAMRFAEKLFATCANVNDVIQAASTRLDLHTVFTVMSGQIRVFVRCSDQEIIVSRVMAADFEDDVVIAPYRVLRLTMDDHGCVYLVRKSVLQEVSWSGDPTEAPINIDGDVHPRNSFKKFVQQSLQEPLEWSITERDIVDLLRLHIHRVIKIKS
jgi:light-regulated signal transduction histidine kinase (bacteriophytochrome)